MRLKARELLDVHARIVDYLESIEQDSIDVDADYFWEIDRKERYDVGTRPANLTIGQLTEVDREIHGILAGKEPVGYALVWLGTLLRAYGERTKG
jgi:RecA-family ATPase